MPPPASLIVVAFGFRRDVEHLSIAVRARVRRDREKRPGGTRPRAGRQVPDDDRPAGSAGELDAGPVSRTHPVDRDRARGSGLSQLRDRRDRRPCLATRRRRCRRGGSGRSGHRRRLVVGAFEDEPGDERRGEADREDRSDSALPCAAGSDGRRRVLSVSSPRCPSVPFRANRSGPRRGSPDFDRFDHRARLGVW